MPPKHIIAIFCILLLTDAITKSVACSCIGPKTTKDELKSVDLAIRGKVMSVTNFDYYDTVAYKLSGRKFTPDEASYMVRRFQMYTLIVNKKYKFVKGMADTIQIVTGYGAGDCGYPFELGNVYIVYGREWKEKAITAQQDKKEERQGFIEMAVPNRFTTSICNLTQKYNKHEIKKLRHLTQ